MARKNMITDPIGGKPPTGSKPSVSDLDYQVKYQRAFEAVVGGADRGGEGLPADLAEVPSSPTALEPYEGVADDIAFAEATM